MKLSHKFEESRLRARPLEPSCYFLNGDLGQVISPSLDLFPHLQKGEDKSPHSTYPPGWLGVWVTGKGCNSHSRHYLQAGFPDTSAALVTYYCHWGWEWGPCTCQLQTGLCQGHWSSASAEIKSLLLQLLTFNLPWKEPRVQNEALRALGKLVEQVFRLLLFSG